MRKTLWPFLRPYRRELVLGPLFKCGEALIELLLPFFLARLIDEGVNRQNPAFVWRMGLIMLTSVCIGVLLSFSCQYMAALCSQGFGTKLRAALFQRIMGLDAAAIQQLGQSSLINRMTSDINQLQIAVAMTIRLVSRAPFLTLGSLIFTFIINRQLGLILLAAIPFAALLLWLIMRAAVRVYRRVQKGLDKVTSLLRDNLAGSRVVRAFAKEEHEKKLFGSKNRDLADETIRAGRVSALMNPVTSLIFNMLIIVVLWRGGLLLERGSLSQGDVVAVINYLTQIVIAMMVVANLLIMFPRAYSSAQRLTEAFHREASVAELSIAEESVAEESIAKTGAAPTKFPIEGVPLFELRDVSFTYPDAQAPALQGLNLVIKSGQTLGVIGATGSGKSTLLRLLQRFYDVSAGAILFEGRDIRRMPLKDLRAAISYVPQKAVLFEGSIRSNLLLGHDQALPDERLWEALELAQAKDFVLELAQRLDAPVERGGDNFSGGQKIRLTIARAILKPAALLLLDDVTAALDYRTDFRLRQALALHAKKQAVLLVSQRVHVVRSADQILLLDDSRVVGQGSHADLLASHTLYQEICASQLEEGGEPA